MADSAPEQQCRIVNDNHHRIGWLPDRACKIGREVPGAPGWVIAETWHARRRRVGNQKSGEYWEYEP